MVASDDVFQNGLSRDPSNLTRIEYSGGIFGPDPAVWDLNVTVIF
jgi:hypothetical protein